MKEITGRLIKKLNTNEEQCVNSQTNVTKQ